MATKNTGQTVIQKTILTQIKRQSLDIADFLAAIKIAEKDEKPRRHKIYDIYSNIALDPHVSSVIEKRKDAILNSRIEFSIDGKPDDLINAQLKSPWFLRFLNDLMDTRGWGFSLFQFYRDGEWINYDLIPRKHVSPKERLLLVKQEDQNGEDYTGYPNMLECGDPTDLGLLCKITPFAIYKRNCMAD